MNSINWEERYKSMCRANEHLEKELTTCQNKIVELMAEKRSWDAEKFVQQSIVQKSLQKSNEELKKLRFEIKRLREKHGDFN